MFKTLIDWISSFWMIIVYTNTFFPSQTLITQPSASAVYPFIRMIPFSTLCATLTWKSGLMHAYNTKRYLLTGLPILLCCLTYLCCLNPTLLYSLRCLVFPGVIWSSSSRYGGRPVGAQHPPGHPETQFPVEARHEHFTGCPGAAGWACQGKAAVPTTHRDSL